MVGGTVVPEGLRVEQGVAVVGRALVQVIGNLVNRQVQVLFFDQERLLVVIYAVLLVSL